jgi:hypothetical protein
MDAASAVHAAHGGEEDPISIPDFRELATESSAVDRLADQA